MNCVPTFSILLFELLHIERSRIISPPFSQIILMDEIANFVCVGAGSFINISWKYNEVCNTTICGDAVTIVLDTSGEARQRQISSRLTIDASRLQLPSAEDFSSAVQCILEQIVPEEFGLQGIPNLIFSARLTITNLDGE